MAEGFPGRPKRAVEGELVQRIEVKEIVEKIGRQLSEAELDELMEWLEWFLSGLPERTMPVATVLSGARIASVPSGPCPWRRCSPAP